MKLPKREYSQFPIIDDDPASCRHNTVYVARPTSEMSILFRLRGRLFLAARFRRLAGVRAHRLFLAFQIRFPAFSFGSNSMLPPHILVIK